MTTVFIAGSISINHLHEKVKERISKIVSSDFDVVVGDADGADTSIQECLLKYRAVKVTVYCTGERPRNNVAEWPVHRVSSKAKVGTRAYFTAKDLEMARRSDYGLMIWDCKSTGTLGNVIELLREKKKSLVFVNKKTDFVTICDRAGLDHLLTFMSDNARTKAEEKISLSSKLASIEQEELSFDASANASISAVSESAAAMPQDALIGAAQPEASQATEVHDTARVSGAERNGGAIAAPVNESASSAYDPVSQTLDESEPAAVPAVENSGNSQNMKLRSELMSALKEHISRARLSQSQAAKVFGVTQPRISDLNREKVDLFGLEALVNMAVTAGLRVEMRVSRNRVRRHAGARTLMTQHNE